MTQNQNRAFWGLITQIVKKTQLDRDDVVELARDVVESVSGQRSIRELTDAQAGEVLKQLGKKLRAPSTSPSGTSFAAPATPPAQDARALPTDAQLQMIERMRKAMDWSRSQLQAWCQNHASVQKPWPQTREEANAIVEALKDMVARERPPLDRKQLRAHLHELLNRRDELPLTSFELAFLDRVARRRMTILQQYKLEEIYRARVGV